MVGAITLSLVPVIVKSRIGGGVEVETAINLFFAIGIAVGSLLAAALAHGRIQLAPTPFMLIVMGALAIHLGVTARSLPHASTEVGLAEFFGSAAGLRIALEIFAYSCAAGLFVVPIFAAVQTWSGEDRRARVIGAVNTLNSIYMVGGSIAVTLILKLTGIDEASVARGAQSRQHFGRLLFLPPSARQLSRLHFASGLAGSVPPGGRRAREPARARPAQRDLAQPCFLSRRADHPFAARCAADLRGRPRHRRSLVDAAFPETRRRPSARSEQAAGRARADPGGPSRAPARHLPGGADHCHRFADEDL